jgi:transposase
MIKVDEKETIRRLYFIKRHSTRQIARERHHSRKTVKKAIMDGGVPEYHLTRDKPYPVMGSYRDIIEGWLKGDRSQPKKQRHTARRIYQRLVSEYLFTGAERTVRDYVRKLRFDLGEMAIPLEFDPGSDAQCDWGEAWVYMEDKLTRVQAFCAKLCYSGKPFVMAFPTQRQEAFFEGHRQAFEWYEGVPSRISYDNLTTAVRKVLQGHQRKEQESFIAFRSHYLFESHFATPGKPREQGRVESLVGYMRRNYFVPVPRVKSYEELNQLLLERLVADEGRKSPGSEMTVREAWEKEKAALLPLPKYPHRCCVNIPVRSNRLSLVSFDSNRYSVPVEHGLRQLVLHAYAWKVEIACGDRVITSHQRCYGKGQDIMKVEHYLPLLLKRPGAFPYAKPVRHWYASGIPEVYRDFLKALQASRNGDSPREFLLVLSLGRSCGKEQLEQAMRQALGEGRADYERVRQLITGSPASGINQLALSEVRVILPDTSQFDRLWRAGEQGEVVA